MKHQFRGLRTLLLGLAVMAAIGPAPVSGRTVQLAFQQSASAEAADPTCNFPTWVCTGVNYGSTAPPPPDALPITYVTDYRDVLDCADNITVTQAVPGSGMVKLNCPDWPEPATIRECPVNEVVRNPYPRALVTIPITFTFNPTSTPVTHFAVAGPPIKNTTEYADDRTSDGVMTIHGAAGLVYLQVRGTRLDAGTDWLGQKVLSPTWAFQDRSWNGSRPYSLMQRGISATFEYGASSFGLPEAGRGFDALAKLPANTYELPAYPVQMATPCKYEYKLVVQKHWPYWTYNQPPDANGNRTSLAGRWNEQWVNVSTGWRNINMKDHGYPNTYEWWDLVRSGGKFKNVDYWDEPYPSQNIWVPVLESQSVLRSGQCAQNGGSNCPKAGTASLSEPTDGSTGLGSLTGGMPGSGGIINPPE